MERVLRLVRCVHEGQTVLTGEAWRECQTALPTQSSVLHCGNYLVAGREEQMIEVMPVGFALRWITMDIVCHALDAQYMPETCPTHTQYTPNVCALYAQYMPNTRRVCPTYAQYMPNM